MFHGRPRFGRDFNISTLTPHAKSAHLGDVPRDGGADELGELVIAHLTPLGVIPNLRNGRQKRHGGGVESMFVFGSRQSKSSPYVGRHWDVPEGYVIRGLGE